MPSTARARIAARIGRRHGPLPLAAGRRVHALEADAGRVAQFGFQGATPIATLGARRRQRHRRLQLHGRQRRLVGHARHAALRLGQEGHGDRLEVEQQRIGRGVVGPQRLAVEQRGIVLGQLEGGAVEHDVAHDHLHALRPQPLHQQPQALDHQLRIALALDVHVALQAAALGLGVQVDRRFPDESGAQQVQRGIGGDQLHHRRGVGRHLGAVGQARRQPALGIGHQHRQRLARHLGAGQGSFHGRGQG
ncbi:hypothetical protein QE399_001631 [Paracidovorax wautersii]|uniref:Uncharacterized protein n=1 Tax=Paracidovorax wautersii TaxID=1177982 RepID=A0ABU1I9N7_9BURK|nr:hypothetical protein [Paracidovorax wautersii]